VQTLVENSADVTEDPFLRKAKMYLHFVENPGNVPDPAPDMTDPDDNNNPKNRPGRYLPLPPPSPLCLLALLHHALEQQKGSQ